MPIRARKPPKVPTRVTGAGKSILRARQNVLAAEYDIPVPNVLLSYDKFKNNLFAKLKLVYGQNLPKVMIDSGAFSAFNLGRAIDLDKYIAFLHTNADHIECYINLDVIQDAEGSERNLLEMRRQGLDPIPVFHHGSPWSEWERMLERHSYVALGGMVGARTEYKQNFLLRAWKLVEKRGYEGRIHGLGITRIQFLRMYPWASVDSSRWTSGARWGRMDLFHGGQMRRMKLWNMSEAYENRDFWRSYGVTPNQVGSKRRYEIDTVHSIGVISWTRVEQWIGEQESREGKPFTLYLVYY